MSNQLLEEAVENGEKVDIENVEDTDGPLIQMVSIAMKPSLSFQHSLQQKNLHNNSLTTQLCRNISINCFSKFIDQYVMHFGIPYKLLLLYIAVQMALQFRYGHSNTQYDTNLVELTSALRKLLIFSKLKLKIMCYIWLDDCRNR